MKIEKLAVQDLYILTELFDYNNVEQMISECTRDIQNGIIDIFVLYDKELLIGELRVMYESDDENYAVRGRRAYMFAFRIREGFQNKGCGTYLIKTVLTELEENGYCEITVGVEDDNYRAIHMYQALGFNEFVLRKQEEYQGDAYEYNLYLKRLNESQVAYSGKPVVGNIVKVTVDRPLGTYHPKHEDIYYPINYGYVEGIMAPDGEEQDAYILGVNEPVKEFVGKIIAIIHRYDDIEEKWVVAPEDVSFTKEEIMEQVKFQEQYFESEIRM